MSAQNDKELQKIMRAIAKSGKYDVGLKESFKSLNNVKLLIYSSDLDKTNISNIEDSCKKSSVPVIAFPGSSMALGRVCGKAFKVKVISVRSTGDTDISSLFKVEK